MLQPNPASSIRIRYFPQRGTFGEGFNVDELRYGILAADNPLNKTINTDKVLVCILSADKAQQGKWTFNFTGDNRSDEILAADEADREIDMDGLVICCWV